MAFYEKFPLWKQFIERKDEWIGGELEDLGDDDPLIPNEPAKTIITDITLEPNGDAGYFSVWGVDFSCGFSTDIGGIDGSKLQDPDSGWLWFAGYQGHSWRIRRPQDGH